MPGEEENEIIQGVVEDEPPEQANLLPPRSGEYGNVLPGSVIEVDKFQERFSEGERWGSEVAATLYTEEGRQSLEAALAKKVTEEISNIPFLNRIGLKESDFRSRALGRLRGDNYLKQELKDDEEVIRRYSSAKDFVEMGSVSRKDGNLFWFSQVPEAESVTYEKGFRQGWRSVVEQSPFQDEISGKVDKPWYVPSKTEDLGARGSRR